MNQELNYKDYKVYTDCSFISYLGIVGICDIKPDFKDFLIYAENCVGFTNLDDIKLDKDGCIIFLKPDYIMVFAECILNKLTHKIILVSTGSDYIIPSDVPLTESWKKILMSDKIIKWYTTNCGLKFPKLVPIPLGVPYDKFRDPKIQEEELQSVSKIMKPLCETNWKAVTNFQHVLEYKKAFIQKIKLTSRTEVYEKLKNKDYITFLPKQDRIDFWKSCNDSMFVISPFGNGPDCHRTWEALSIGRVPIIQKFPMNSMFDDLPVVIVNDWKEVTEEFLQKNHKIILENFNQGKYNMEKLSLKYWEKIIKN